MATAVNEIFNTDGSIGGVERLGNVTIRTATVDSLDYQIYNGGQTTTVITTALSRRYNGRANNVRFYTGDAAT